MRLRGVKFPRIAKPIPSILTMEGGVLSFSESNDNVHNVDVLSIRLSNAPKVVASFSDFCQYFNSPFYASGFCFNLNFPEGVIQLSLPQKSGVFLSLLLFPGYNHRFGCLFSHFDLASVIHSKERRFDQYKKRRKREGKMKDGMNQMLFSSSLPFPSSFLLSPRLGMSNLEREREPGCSKCHSDSVHLLHSLRAIECHSWGRFYLFIVVSRLY